jgi:hypothetical protein
MQTSNVFTVVVAHYTSALQAYLNVFFSRTHLNVTNIFCAPEF